MQFVKPENTPEKGIEREDNFTHSSSQKILVREREREREILQRSSCGERRKLKRRSSSHGGRKQSNRLQIARSAATPSTLFLSLCKKFCCTSKELQGSLSLSLSLSLRGR
jgi:hypothetical protein